MKKIILTALCILIAIATDARKPKRTQIEMLTSKGLITIELYNETPLHRDNFIRLVEEGYYKDLLFHRVIADFMIQGGDPDSKDAPAHKQLGEGGPDYTIPAEFHYPQLYHKRGALAAAREGDTTNPEQRSSGSQFYIVWGKTFTAGQIEQMALALERHSNGQLKMTEDIKRQYTRYGGTPHLDGAYTVFGEVVKGLEVVNAIQQVATNRFDRPLEDVKILNVSIKKRH